MWRRTSLRVEKAKAWFLKMNEQDCRLRLLKIGGQIFDEMSKIEV